MVDQGGDEKSLQEVLDGIRTLDEHRVQFFAQLASLLPAVRDTSFKDSCDIDIPESLHFWHRVLKWLVDRNHWRGIYCLFNPRGINTEDYQWSPLHGRAVGVSVDDIRVSDLLQSASGQDLKAWGICLAIWLLKQGARIELISSDEEESLTIAAVKTSLKAGVSELLSFVMEMRPELTLSLDDVDQSGDSPLHLCVKFQEPVPAESGAAVVLQTLLDLGCCTSVRDRQFKTPIQYVEEQDSRYTKLSRAAKHAGTGLKDRIMKMKRLGDDHFQKDEFEESLSWYKKSFFLAESAPNMNLELAVLYSACSCVYANLAVLEDKDVACASSPMFKELSKSNDDLAAVFSSIINPDATPRKERTLEDIKGPVDETNVSFEFCADTNETLPHTRGVCSKVQEHLGKGVDSNQKNTEDEETQSHLLLSTGALQNKVNVTPWLLDSKVNTRAGTGHIMTVTSEEDRADGGISNTHFAKRAYLNESCDVVEWPQEKSDEKALLNSSDCTTVVEEEHVNNPSVISEKHPVVNCLSINDIDKLIPKQIKQDFRELDQLKIDCSDKHPSSIDLIMASHELQEALESESKYESQAQEAYEMVQRLSEETSTDDNNYRKDEILPMNTVGKSGNQSAEEVEEDEKMSEERERNDENQLFESSGRYEPEINKRNGHKREKSNGKTDRNQTVSTEAMNGNQFRAKARRNENQGRVTSLMAPEKEITKKMDEQHSAEQGNKSENSSEVPDIEDHDVGPWTGHKTFRQHFHDKGSDFHKYKKQVKVDVLFEHTYVGKNGKASKANNPVSKITPSFPGNGKQKKVDMSKLQQSSESVESDVKTVKGNLFLDDCKAYGDEQKVTGDIEVEKKQMLECKRKMNENTQDGENNLYKEIDQNSICIRRDNSEIDDLAKPCRKNNIAIDLNDKDLAIDTETFDKATWEIECSANACKQLKETNMPISLRRQVIKCVEMLASGVWKNIPCKKIQQTKNTYASKVSKSRDCSLIWELTVAFSGRCSDKPELRFQEKTTQAEGRIYTEVIRIWGVAFSEVDILKLAELVQNSRKRAEDCCLRKQLRLLDATKFEAGSKTRIPRQFSEVMNDDQGKTVLWCPPVSEHKAEYQILKFFAFSSALVNSLLRTDTEKIYLPFKVTPTQHDLVRLQAVTPILLIGRSGTGKTTCCLYRLWNNFISYWQINQTEEVKPLLSSVDYFSGCKQDIKEEKEITSAEANEHNENEADADGEANDKDADDEDADDKDGGDQGADKEDDYEEYVPLHQMFVTKKSLVCEKVKKNFLKFCSSHDEMLKHVEAASQDPPANLQDVSDLSYPLFLTSRQLLHLLDASLGQPFFLEHGKETSFLQHDSDEEDEFAQVDIGSIPDPTQLFKSRSKHYHQKEVTFEVFTDKVWPTIRKKIGVRFNPYLVWTEMISFIMGSNEALKPEGYLLETEYIEIGRKRAPYFSGDRSRIYELFRRYVNFKSEHQMFDETDFLRSIFNRLSKMPKLPWVLHELYIDDTQEFSQLELIILFGITQDPNKVFLTGDTAEGITGEITFSFSGLKDLFHQSKISHNRRQMWNLNEPKEMYQLMYSHRSNDRCLKLASAVLQPMIEFFPENFDRLQKVQAFFHGPQPVLLEFSTIDDLMDLMQSNNRRTSHIEFGAHQVILVSSDAAKESLPEELSHGIVLTIKEAKGLDFDDVLLFNFFNDSEASKEWRVVTSFLKKNTNTAEKETDNLIDFMKGTSKQSKRPHALTFDQKKCTTLIAEMKNLYTALMRARVNVWIFDTNKEKRAPMFEYFKARNLVRCITQKIIDAIRATEDRIFGEKSTSEDWIKRGDDMMGHCLYEVAAKCYRMGNEETKENIALAHNQALKASSIKDNPKKMREEFVFASEKFMESGHDNKAVLCLKKAKEYELAAQMLEKRGQLVDAAEMYWLGKKYVDSSRCYEQLGNYHKALEVLDKGELYVQAIDCLERYKVVVTEYERKGQELPQPLLKGDPSINFTEANLVIKAVNFFYINKNELRMVEALECLPGGEDKLEFLKTRGYMEQAATILMTEGKTTKAARMMLQHGKTEKALQFAELGDDHDVLGDCHYAQALACMSSKEDFNQEKIIGHLNSAKDAFIKMNKINSVGVAYLDIASIKLDIEIAKKAFLTFKEVKPFENEVGKLEALNLVVDLSSLDEEFGDIKAVIRGVNSMFEVMKALLQPSSMDEKSKALFYLQFYGLHEKDENTLVVYPKQNPHCVRAIPNFYCSKLEKKQPSVDKDKTWVCVKITSYLVAMLKTWISHIRVNLKNHIAKRLQCKSHLEGEECPFKGFCPYFHKNYDKRIAFLALDALLWEVHLDSILQSGAKMMKTLFVLGFQSEVRNFYRDIVLLFQVTEFDSCERLLDFLMPEHHHMKIISENPAVMSELLSHLSFGKISDHVRYYLDNCWKGHGDYHSKMELLEQRSKSTDWFVRATTFASIFKLKLDIKKECHKLEGELMKFTPKWLNERKKYALLVEFFCHTPTVECLGGKFCSAYEWLQEKPLKAIIEYAKFVKILSDRGRMSLFPKMPLFLFWQEVFMSISLLTIANFPRVSASFFLPATYLSTIPFLNATFPCKDLSIEELIYNTFDSKENIEIIRDLVKSIAGVLCGQRMNLLEMIFTPKTDESEIQYLQAERCLVLALVVLVNIGTFVPHEIENPLMSTIVNLRLPRNAPFRLRNTLKAMQTSRDYLDLLATLKDLLFQREKEYLLTCSWKWDSRRGQGIQFKQVERLDDFSHRLSYIEYEDVLQSRSRNDWRRENGANQGRAMGPGLEAANDQKNLPQRFSWD